MPNKCKYTDPIRLTNIFTAFNNQQKKSFFSQTDEGAPLMCYSNSKSSWQMKGILSYRNGCRRHTLPAVYSAFTPSLLKWITKTIGNEEMIQRRSGWLSTTTRFLYIFYWNWKRLDTVNEKFTHGLGADCNKKKSMIFLSIS